MRKKEWRCLTKMANDYNSKVKNLFKKKGIKSSITKIGKDKYFPTDKEPRNIYMLTLEKDNKKSNFRYGDSIDNTRKGIPAKKEDVLGTIVREKQDSEGISSVKDVKDNFGYESDREAKRVFNGLKKNENDYDKVIDNETNEELKKIYEDY